MWEKRGMQALQDPREVYLGVFDSRVVSIQEKRSKTQTGENCQVFDAGMQRFQSLASIEIAPATTGGSYGALILSCLLSRKRN